MVEVEEFGLYVAVLWDGQAFKGLRQIPLFHSHRIREMTVASPLSLNLTCRVPHLHLPPDFHQEGRA
jgi:hypothetical protein